MRSLVVLFSVVALAAAKPSQLIDSGIVAYSTPLITNGAAAVSHQARLDIKTSPTIVENAAFAPVATRIFIDEPTVLAAPVIAAPGAVSSQSRIDIKTTPAITKTVIATGPLTYSAPIATAVVSPSLENTKFIGPAITTAAFGPAFVKTLTPDITAPALIKTGDLVPAGIETAALSFGTPTIALAHDATIETNTNIKTGAHVLKKRSAPVLSYASTPLVSTYAASPLVYTTPIKVGSPILTKTYSLHSW